MMRPTDIPLPFIEEITNKFSEERKIGHGGYGEVYKGVLYNGTAVAVKKLYDIQGLDNKQFRNEFENLTRVQHPNIVRLIGYCDEERLEPFKLDGNFYLCKRIYRILCFEFLHQGSLDKHLYEEFSGPDWHTRYKIIKGICEGLNYLHGELKKPIFHLDLKPANILLDKNLVPKIADFGLSRLFGETHTHITTECKGTEYYMPPEYTSNRQISEKYDIFSLGVIIIQIMSGPMGFTKYGAMSPQQFIELVEKNWTDRIQGASKYLKEDCYQVKRCIEIAVSCVNIDRDKRPTIRDITHELKVTETNVAPLMKLQARVAKIGQWGGAGGSDHRDIEVEPCRLETVIITSDEVIYSLEFSYIDHKAQQHTAGPWGGYGPNKGRKRNMILLGISEYIMKVSGTIGPFDSAPAGVITSLTFITNVGSYGPFGALRGTPFQIPVRSNGSIVGFFARAGWYVDAFGVYVNPRQETTEEAKMGTLAKIGPWGGSGGEPYDIKVAPHRLESVTIHCGSVIDSLEFSYSDRDGHKHTLGPWGGLGGTACTIQFGRSEFLTGVYGTTGPYTNTSGLGANVVTSLMLVTNARSCGPFGQGGGTAFQIPVRGNGSILGFFACADTFLHAIGVYINPEQEALEQEVGITKSGPWGGSVGRTHYIDKLGPQLHRLESVTIRSGVIIDSLEFTYSDQDGNKHTVGPWGGRGGNAYTIRLHPLESLQGISGTFGTYDASPNNVITSLTFATNQCRNYGPFGEGGGTPFTAPTESDGCIVGFFGCGGSYLEAIGVYTRADEL